MSWIEMVRSPWPWYVAGPIIGLMVPALLLIGNRSLGISSSFRHICAACFPGNVDFFNYNWKKEVWNIFFALGVIAGGFIAFHFLHDPNPININPELKSELSRYGINNYSHMVPVELFNWQSILTIKGFITMIVGGFLVGFGTRYAGGCTSGHSIMGLSNLQWPSLLATICFMAGGFLMANLIYPLILNLQ